MDQWEFKIKLDSLKFLAYSTHPLCENLENFRNLFPPLPHGGHSISSLHFPSFSSLNNFSTLFEDIWSRRPYLSSWHFYSDMEKQNVIISILDSKMQEWIAKLLLDVTSMVTLNLIKFGLLFHASLSTARPAISRTWLVIRALNTQKVWTRQEVILLLCNKNMGNWFSLYWSGKLLAEVHRFPGNFHGQIPMAWSYFEPKGEFWINSFSFLKLYSITTCNKVIPMVFPSYLVDLFYNIRFDVNSDNGLHPGHLMVGQFCFYPTVFTQSDHTFTFPAHFMLPKLYFAGDSTGGHLRSPYSVMTKVDLGFASRVHDLTLKTEFDSYLKFFETSEPFWGSSAVTQLLKRQRNKKTSSPFLTVQPVEDISDDSGVDV